MARARRPKPLGLEIVVMRPKPETERGPALIDADGHEIGYEMVSMRGKALCRLVVRRGIAPREAVKLLRKLVERLESHGADLLSLERGECGHFDASGAPVKSAMSLDHEKSGNEFPDIANWPTADPEDMAGEEWKDAPPNA